MRCAPKQAAPEQSVVAALAWMFLHSARIFVLVLGVRSLPKISVQTKDVGAKIVMVDAMECLQRILLRTANRRAAFAR